MKLDVTNFNNDPATANARQKAAAARPWVTKAAWRIYRVVGRGRRNGKYVVTFTVDERLRRRFAECRDVRTGDECKANANGRFCYHVAAAHARHVTNATRLKAQRSRPVCHAEEVPKAA